MYPSRPQIRSSMCQMFESIGTITVKEIYSNIRERFSMTTEELSREFSCGACRIEHEIRWELQNLKNEGRITRTDRRGEWRAVQNAKQEPMDGITQYDSDSQFGAKAFGLSNGPTCYYRLTLQLADGWILIKDYYSLNDARLDAKTLIRNPDEQFVNCWCDDAGIAAIILSSNIISAYIEERLLADILPAFIGNPHCEKNTLTTLRTQ